MASREWRVASGEWRVKNCSPLATRHSPLPKDRNRDPRRRARAVLAWGALIFLTAQLAASLVLDYGWPMLRFPSAGRVLERARAAPGPAVVFFGSSRFEEGIDADEVAELHQRACGLDRPLP